MRGDLAKREPAWVKAWQEHRALPAPPRGGEGPAALRAARRPAVRERRHPHRHTRSTRSSRTWSSSRRRWPASTRRTCPAGTATACRSRCRSRSSTAATSRRRRRSASARAYATEQIERQKADFQRLGRARRLGRAVPHDGVRQRGRRDPRRSAGCWRRGTCYRGLKPVNWCFDCGSALAEAEVEYEDRKDPAIDVGFPFGDSHKLARAFGLQRLDDKPGFAVIWTTTPWTMPANQALNVHPESRLRPGRHAARVSRARGRPAGSLPDPLRAHRHDGRRGEGRGARGTRVPPSVLRPARAGVPRRVRDARRGHRHRAQRARVRRRGLRVVPALRHARRRDPEPGAGRRALRGEPAVLRRDVDLGREPEDRREAARGRRAPPRGAARPQLHALLAPQDAGHPARDDAVVRRHGRRAGVRRPEAGRSRCARPRCAASRRRSSFPAGARRGCTA